MGWMWLLRPVRAVVTVFRAVYKRPPLVWDGGWYQLGTLYFRHGPSVDTVRRPLAASALKRITRHSSRPSHMGVPLALFVLPLIEPGLW